MLIDLFDREFIESQEATGMAILGQFRDLDDSDRFVWLRGFADMPRRAEALTRFYGGPAWRAHSAEANATMVDVDNVLLLRPATAHTGFPASSAARPPRGSSTPLPTVIVATLYYRDHAFDEAFLDFFDHQVRPVLVGSGAAPLACLQTEYATNNYPALPVRTGEHVFVWFARFASLAHLREHQDQLERSEQWQVHVLPHLSKALIGAPQQLRLTPTARSELR